MALGGQPAGLFKEKCDLQSNEIAASLDKDKNPVSVVRASLEKDAT